MEDLPIDIILQEADDLRETIKCGAVHLNLEKLAFSFSCGYCDLEFESLRLFAEHFTSHLVMSESENDIFLKNAEDENTQSIDDETIHDNFPNSMMDGDDEDSQEIAVRDYQIEMLDESTQDNVEFVSNNENTEDQFVYQVHLFKNTGDEVQYDESLLTNKIDLNPSEIQEAPDLGFDIIPQTNSKSPAGKMKKEISYICEICGIKFAEASTLQVHIQRHNRCQYCQQHFGSKAQLKQHIKLHAAQKPFICDECGQSYKNAESLLNHHHRRHVTEQLFICNTCGKSFKEERLLRLHIQTHTSARPFICKECNMTFSRQEALMLHATMHSDIRKFSCTICRMTFAQNSGLLSHMKEKHRNNIDSG